MPTIIRPNRLKVAAVAATAAAAVARVSSRSNVKELSGINFVPALHVNSLVSAKEEDATWSARYSESPPEPSIPPPALPAAAAATVTIELGATEYAAVALYDYKSPHDGDLNFWVR